MVPQAYKMFEKYVDTKYWLNIAGFQGYLGSFSPLFSAYNKEDYA
jgi:hypothetical protein